MTSRGGVQWTTGSRILLPPGPAIVVAIEPHGVAVKGALGDIEHLRWGTVIVRDADVHLVGQGEVLVNPPPRELTLRRTVLPRSWTSTSRARARRRSP